MTAGICSSTWQVVITVGLVSVSCVCCSSHFTDRYAVQVDGGVDEARRVALQHGFVFVNEVQSLRLLFLLRWYFLVVESYRLI